MVLRPASDSSINGTAFATILSKILGGVLISADSTNDTTVTIRENDSGGRIAFELITKTPAFICAPFQLLTDKIHITCTGTGGGCFVYEWIP